jgi:hypothetical protein
MAMTRKATAAVLREFAEKRLNAAFYSECSHQFVVFECPECRAIEFEVLLARHPRDTRGDFHGIMSLTCASCGSRHDALGVTDAEKPPDVVQLEHPACDCGARIFALGNCERWEDWGFFDEGTVVARCQACDALRVILDTD